MRTPDDIETNHGPPPNGDAARQGAADRPVARRGDPATEGTGIMWTGVIVVVTIALGIVAAFQNTQDVMVEFLWLDGSLPLALLLLIAVGVTVVLTEAIGFVWRRRRRTRIRERRELRQLRDR